MADLGTPILATRAEDGGFRAFVNACRHRGTAVEERHRGTTRRFTCPFHGWSYDLDGTLVGIPKSDHFGPIDPSCHGLVELPTDERAGLLIVHPDPTGSIDPASIDPASIDGAALLDPDLESELTSWGLADLRPLTTDSYDMALNWKLAMDTFGETYHFPVLHRDTLAMSFHGNVQCYDTFGRNHRMILCRRDIDWMRHQPETEWRITIGGLPVYYLFPNVQLIVNQFGLQLVRAYPVPGQPGRHVSRIGFYLREGSAEDRDARQIATAFAEIIRDEDYRAATTAQAAAESGAVDHLLFGRNEPALHHYHNTFRSALGLDPLPLLTTAS